MTAHATPASRLVLVITALALLGGCASDAALDVAEALPAAFTSGVPEPSEEVVLTVVADGTSPNWDLDTLAQLEQHQLTIVEPFLDQEMTFSGPLWSDVLRASGVDLAATTSVELIALDDYVANVPADAEVLDGLLLATSVDGRPIDIADGGPIRLVFPDGNPAAGNLNNWIWSIRSATAS